jgi:hypothetical protein
MNQLLRGLTLATSALLEACGGTSRSITPPDTTAATPRLVKSIPIPPNFEVHDGSPRRRRVESKRRGPSVDDTPRRSFSPHIPIAIRTCTLRGRP